MLGLPGYNLNGVHLNAGHIYNAFRVNSTRKSASLIEPYVICEKWNEAHCKVLEGKNETMIKPPNKSAVPMLARGFLVAGLCTFAVTQAAGGHPQQSPKAPVVKASSATQPDITGVYETIPDGTTIPGGLKNSGSPEDISLQPEPLAAEKQMDLRKIRRKTVPRLAHSE